MISSYNFFCFLGLVKLRCRKDVKFLIKLINNKSQTFFFQRKGKTFRKKIIFNLKKKPISDFSCVYFVSFF